MMSVLSMEVILGSLTFTGSLMAAGKLQEILPQRPITYRGQNLVNIGLLAVAVAVAVYLVLHPGETRLFPLLIVIPLLFGVLMIIPIGGADMPTVISLLNSYAGLSAAAMGFVINSKLLIVAGALDGSSGFILSVIMSKAMNRSFSNVLFGAFGQVQVSAAAAQEARPVHTATAEEAAAILGASYAVVIVPGYGMAVAQAQHKVRELYDALTKRGVDVKFAIHPDVTNPAARNDSHSPIYGMPILDVDKARTVMVIKRGMSPGFAGIDNELYYLDKTLMLFGDARAVVGDLVKQLGGEGHE
jgi:NAD(P) transhydrogenase subunit beta